ncbi:hypothetical protein FRC06_003184 [Ceratobasidium sp. 370]|nr:hypothetical protein FRC06_003184 [Ceratobasidium sp. 370]
MSGVEISLIFHLSGQTGLPILHLIIYPAVVFFGAKAKIAKAFGPPKPNDEVLATSDGCESYESLTECHAPFEYDCPTPTEPQDLTRTLIVQEPGFGVSETMRAINSARMLDDPGTYGLNEDPITGLDQKLGDLLATDEGDYETEQEALYSVTEHNIALRSSMSCPVAGLEFS